MKPKEAKPIPQNEEAPKKPSVSLYDKDDQFIKDQPSWIHNSTLTTFMTHQSESNVSTHQQNNDKQSNSSETTAEKTDYFNPTMKLSNFKNIVQKKEENATENEVETCQCSECMQLMSDSPKKIKCHLCDCILLLSEWSHHVDGICHMLKVNGDPDLQFFEDNDLNCSVPNYGFSKENIGYQMVKKMGWKESKGLGADQKGRKEPIDAQIKNNKLGVGHRDTKYMTVSEMNKNKPLCLYDEQGRLMTRKQIKNLLKKATKIKKERELKQKEVWLRDMFRN